MEQFSYLLLTVNISFVWLLIYFCRKDLRRRILKSSIFGGGAGIVSEFWYFSDYWDPPSIFGLAVVSIEDVLFGFLITGVSVSIFDFILSKDSKKSGKGNKKLFGVFFILGLLGLLLFNNFLGFRSILVTSFFFIAFSVIMVIIRHDLLFPSIVSGIFMVIIMAIIYSIVFGIISPEYWNKYLIYKEMNFDLIVCKYIPPSELLWYFAWGCFVGAAYDFTSGRIKTSKGRLESCQSVNSLNTFKLNKG